MDAEQDRRARPANHVLLTGWLPQPAALGYAVRAEVGLSPIPRGTLFDVSSPTKLVEYLALGIPGVANDIPDQQPCSPTAAPACACRWRRGRSATPCLKCLATRRCARSFAARGPG